jgi:hypothetical protein
MKRISMVALAAVAMFAFSVASASAAQPVFYTVAEMGGSPPSVVKLSGTLGAAFLEGKTSKAKITCTGGTAVGEVTGATKTKGNVTTFTGCETQGLKCASAGDPEGTIKTAALEGVLGQLKENSTPGIRLFAPGEGGKSPKTGALATFECGGGVVKVVVVGSVIGSLSGAQGLKPEEGKFGASSKLTFAETAGAQKYVSFVGGFCGGNANDCGPEQLTSKINGGEELGGQSVIATLKSAPFASKLGFTK